MNSRCVIICASPINDIKHIKDNIRENDYVICADAGYITAKKAQVNIDLVIGDFDSLKTVITDIEIIKLPIEKDDTDTFYATKYAIEKGFKEILLLGCIGGRLDHTYANCSILKYLYDHKVKGTIKDENTEIFYSKEKIFIENKKGKTLSLFPFGSENCTVTYSGFKYEVENYTINSNAPIGISNIITENKSYIDINSGGVLIMIYDKI